MTQEEKHTLLVDLCARLPYHLLGIDAFGKLREMKLIYPTGTIIAQEVNGENCAACGFKPYLRPMSSMTNQEIETYRALIGSLLENSVTDNVATLYNFLNSKHLDYRGMIHMGLALEAPEDTYKAN